jgi:hypothetical protein
MFFSLGKWNVRIIKTGDKYGRTMSLVNDKAPMVEFYDGRYQHTPFGQFVSRYYINTILNANLSNGLCLDGRVPEWQVSADDMAQVINFLKDFHATT